MELPGCVCACGCGSVFRHAVLSIVCTSQVESPEVPFDDEAWPYQEGERLNEVPVPPFSSLYSQSHAYCQVTSCRMQSVFTCDMLLFIITDLRACTLLFCFFFFFKNVAHLKIIDWLKFRDAPKPHRNGLLLVCFTSDNLGVTSFI